MNHSNSRRSPRNGVLLIEMLAYLAIAAILLTSVGTTIHGLVRADRQIQSRRGSIASLQRFTERLREDIHLASTLRISSDGALEIERRRAQSPPVRIQYDWQSSTIQRAEQVSGDNREGAPRRDQFRFGTPPDITWSYDEPHRLLQFTIRLRSSAARLEDLSQDTSEVSNSSRQFGASRAIVVQVRIPSTAVVNILPASNPS